MRPFIVALLVGLVFPAWPAGANATVTHIDGRCGIHKGHLVIAGGVDHRYHVRIGVKRGHVGGSHRCHGRYRRHGGGAIPHMSWSSFDLTTWNWNGIIDVGAKTGFTALSCAGFAAAFAGEFPTGGLDTAATAAAGAGCVTGGKLIRDSVNANFYARR